MQKIVLAAVAVGALALGGSAFAQDAQMYVSKDASGKMMVMGGPNDAATELTLSNAGKRPDNCATGGYYQNGQSTIISCDDEKMMFNMEQPEKGAMMSNGQPYPEGSMLMKKSGG